jgi:hypothetical protein
VSPGLRTLPTQKPGEFLRTLPLQGRQLCAEVLLAVSQLISFCRAGWKRRRGYMKLEHHAETCTARQVRKGAL